MAEAKCFVCFCTVCSFEEEDSLKKLHSVLFYLFKKRSVETFVFLILFQGQSVRERRGGTYMGVPEHVYIPSLPEV